MTALRKKILWLLCESFVKTGLWLQLDRMMELLSVCQFATKNLVVAKRQDMVIRQQLCYKNLVVTSVTS